MRNDPLKILVVGCGSIGRRHIRLLKEMGVRVGGIDTVREQALQVGAEFGVTTYTDPDAAKAIQYALTHCYDDEGEDSRWDGAIIATPNHLHREPAEEALRVRLPLLIEKPMFHTLDEAYTFELLHMVYPNVPILVGYCLRYHSGLRRLKELLDRGAIGTVRHASIHFGSYLPDWRPGFDYRQGYAARRETGGGILMDASHELDLCNWWFGKPKTVMSMVRNTGALEGLETEDVADVLIEYECGTQASIHLDYLSRQYQRGCVLVGDKDTLRFEFYPDGYYLQVGSKHNGEYWPVERDVMYRNQLLHFIKVIRGEETPFVSGVDGLTALSVVEAAKRSSSIHGAVYL